MLRRLAAVCLFAVLAHAQQPTHALLLSDIHFEPFTDPDRASELLKAPASEWEQILTHPSPTAAQRFAEVEKSCHVRGQDSSASLYLASLAAMHQQLPDPALITISGDLMSHAFDCKFRAAMPAATAADYRLLAVKTIEFVHLQLKKTFPRAALYFALGNNDSDCGDYKLDPGGEFLRQIGQLFSSDRPHAEQAEVERDFTALGNYSARLPFPHTRLLVIDNLLMAPKASTCNGSLPDRANHASIEWLRLQAEAARRSGEHLWVLGHIPPGVNLHSVVTKGKSLCTHDPAQFTATTELADTLVASRDVVHLALFGHTHMDEIHLITSSQAPASAAVAMKMVPSISPIDGNSPSFTVAEFSPNGDMLNYQVYTEASDDRWPLSYDYAATYHQPNFTPLSVSKLLHEFAADPAAAHPASQAYITHFMPGAPLPFLALAWPQYICTVAHTDASAVQSCACPAQH